MDRQPGREWLSWEKQTGRRASIVFNTLEYAKRLDKMATKQDLRELEYRMTIRFGAMLAAAVAVLAALITFVK